MDTTSFSIQHSAFRNSPHITEHFSTDTSLDRLASRHDTARRRQDAGAESREHVGNLVASKIYAATRTADALDAADDALTTRAILQEHPQLRLHAFPGLGVEHLEALNVAFALENARDLHLQPRRRHFHPGMPGNRRVPDAG